MKDSSSEAENDKFVQYRMITFMKEMQAITANKKAPSNSSNLELRNFNIFSSTHV